MNLKTNIANRNNYGESRPTGDIEYLVIHYTANDGDTDENNGKYFKNNVVKTSAHYFVDDDSVTQTVPDNYTAWHCGTKGTYRHKTCRNANSIGIELCDDVKNGKIYPSEKTIQNALELTKFLMKKYGIPASNVIRHYDVTGKLCPAYWCGTAAKDKLWKTEFWNKLGKKAIVDPAKSFSKTYAKTYAATEQLNMRSGAGIDKTIIKSLPAGSKVTCYGYYTVKGSTTWLYVQDKSGETGYCSKKYLK